MNGPFRLVLSLALLLAVGWGPPPFLPGASAAANRKPEAVVQTAEERGPSLFAGDSDLPAPGPRDGAKKRKAEEEAEGPGDRKPDGEAPPYQQKKTDLLAQRRRSRAPDDRNEAPLSEGDETDTDGLPPHKGAEEMFVGGMLLAISGALKMQNVRSQAGMFLVLVFAIVGLMCALLGALQQLISYRKRKKWVRNQGSLLDHLKE